MGNMVGKSEICGRNPFVISTLRAEMTPPSIISRRLIMRSGEAVWGFPVSAPLKPAPPKPFRYDTSTHNSEINLFDAAVPYLTLSQTLHRRHLTRAAEHPRKENHYEKLDNPARAVQRAAAGKNKQSCAKLRG